MLSCIILDNVLCDIYQVLLLVRACVHACLCACEQIFF